MSTKDYGEPWGVEYQSGDLSSIFNSDKVDIVGHCFHAERIVACVNACAGIDNPASAIAAAREALAQVRRFIDPELPSRIQGELLHEIDAALTLLAPERKERT